MKIPFLHCFLKKLRFKLVQFSGITGLSYRLVQGVVKNIIPAVASTNAAIAATCATEVFKLATSCSASLNNYMVSQFSYIIE